MNWKLIFKLSMFGLAMGLATVFFIPPNIEPVLWFVIFLFCAFRIAGTCPDKRFLHGLFLGIFNCIWITAAHALFADRYLASHPQEAAMMKQLHLSGSPQAMLSRIGPLYGIVFGIMIGILALIAGGIVPSIMPKTAPVLRKPLRGKTVQKRYTVPK